MADGCPEEPRSRPVGRVALLPSSEETRVENRREEEEETWKLWGNRELLVIMFGWINKSSPADAAVLGAPAPPPGTTEFNEVTTKFPYSVQDK